MCMEIAKGRMRISEARTALRELVDTTQDKKTSPFFQFRSPAPHSSLMVG